MKLNLNQTCLIRELPRGVEQFNAHYRALGLDPETHREHYRSADGRLRMQLWVVMEIYGPAVTICLDPPIEMDIELVGV
jgi:hypothetical protein